MKMSKVSVLMLAAVLALTAGISACGRKGDPVLPKEVHKDQYPEQYPKTVKPQTGIFSG
jgi:predicted small lipoprotein YifL